MRQRRGFSGANHEREALLLSLSPLLLLQAIGLHLGLKVHLAVELELGDAAVAGGVGLAPQRVEDGAEIGEPLFDTSTQGGRSVRVRGVCGRYMRSGGGKGRTGRVDEG